MKEIKIGKVDISNLRKLAQYLDFIIILEANLLQPELLIISVDLFEAHLANINDFNRIQVQRDESKGNLIIEGGYKCKVKWPEECKECGVVKHF